MIANRKCIRSSNTKESNDYSQCLKERKKHEEGDLLPPLLSRTSFGRAQNNT